MSNKSTVEDIYKAFGEGNIPAILEHLADDVIWDFASTSIEVPWLKRREGKAGAIEFFQAVGANLEFEKFEPKAILEGDGLVVGVIDVEATVRPTGKKISEVDETHVFRFNGDGKIVAFRHGVDSYEHFRAFEGSADASATTA